MKKVISKIISLYNIYNKIKILKYKFYRFLEFLFVLLKVQKTITIDFITKLPELVDLIIKKKYNIVFIVVDKLIKQLYFIFYNEVILAKKLI